MLCDNPNCCDPDHTAALDTMYNQITCALKTAGSDFIQSRNKKDQSYVIPGWKEYCAEAHTNARNAFLLWVHTDRPRSGPLLRNMQCTRATFKQAMRHCRASESKAHADSLARKLLMKDTKQFWVEIKKLNGTKSQSTAATIGSATGKKAIADMWRNHYQGLLNSIKPNRKSKQIKQQLSNCSERVETISPAEVSNAIKEIKLDKASGLDTLTAEHYKYASSKLTVLLSLCFNSMLVHGHIPKSFSDTILIPIVKDKKGSVSNPDNYRPIALTTAASKIYEKILLFRLQDYLHTCDNQFSFKSHHATDMCVFVLKSVVDFYTSSSSPMYLCFLDASKAFDRVNYWGLFDKLLARNIPLVYVRFLMMWYCTQEFVVRWGSTFSAPFSVSNGVRQGGVLSPVLFNVYMDNLSEALNMTNVGCMINNTHINHLMYADDLVLLAPSMRALQTLLDTCSTYAEDNDITYNALKSACMCIRPSIFKSDFKPVFVLPGKVLKNVDSNKYLGVQIESNQKDDASMNAQRVNMYCRGNIIIRKFKHCSDNVKTQLFQSYCTNFYCAPLWCNYSAESFRQVKVAYNKIFRNLLGLDRRTSMSAAFVTRHLNPFIVILRKLIVSFRARILRSENSIIETVTNSLYFTFSTLTGRWNKMIF